MVHIVYGWASKISQSPWKRQQGVPFGLLALPEFGHGLEGELKKALGS